MVGLWSMLPPMHWRTPFRCLFVPFLTTSPIALLHAISEATICLLVTHDNDIDTTDTSGSLTTAAPSAVHLAIIAGTIAVLHTIP